VAVSRAKSRRTTSGGGSGPAGFARWLLWLIVVGLLAVIARYAYIAAQPDKQCYALLGRVEGCGAMKDYSASDRAKLDRLIDDALPEKRRSR
jgi:hypothetical protein